MELVSKLLNEIFFMPAIWVIIFVCILRRIFKTKNKKSNQIVFWYGTGLFTAWILLTLKGVFFEDVINPVQKGTYLDFLSRATGPYLWFFIAELIFPFLFFGLLLIPKLRFKSITLFIALLSISFQNWFEIFVIKVTSIHRDLLTSSFPQNPWLNLIPQQRELEKMLIGLAIAVVIFFAFEYSIKNKDTEILDS